MAVETTLVLVKPDGVGRGLCGEIVARLERKGYELRGARLLRITRRLAQEHYAEHKGKPFFRDLVDFISSGPVLALAVRGEDAIAGVRGLMGATHPKDAAPGRSAAITPRCSARTSCTARTRARARDAS
jgi:nucleoside-diphosphate kinase